MADFGTELALVQKDVEYIKQSVDEIKRDLEELPDKFVSQDQFYPIRAIVYGLVGAVLMGVIGAVLALTLGGGSALP